MKMCWDAVADCVVSMLLLDDFHGAFVEDSDRECVDVTGYSFEPKEKVLAAWESMCDYVIPRLPRGMILRVTVVCPNGKLVCDTDPNEDDDEEDE